jgi:hypothetical protein
VQIYTSTCRLQNKNCITSTPVILNAVFDRRIIFFVIINTAGWKHTVLTLDNHAMVQAVNCDLSPRRLGFDPRAICGGQSGIGTGVFLTESFGFTRPITIPPIMHVHSSLFIEMNNSQPEAAVATKSHPIQGRI